MSNYTQITDFSVKDGLGTSDPEKIILGADFDGEFSAISTAIATKYDSANIATQAQAQAGTLDNVLMTPAKTLDVLQKGGGLLEDIQGLADPGADRILFWDDVGAGGVTYLTADNGLEISGTTLQLEAAVAGTGLSYLAGVLSVDASQAGVVTIADTDKMLLGDASNSDAFSYVTWANLKSAITITESQISDLGTYLSSGDTAASLTITTANIGTLNETFATYGTIANVVEAEDGVLITDNGVVKVMDWNDGGVHVETFTASADINDTDYGLYKVLANGVSSATLTFNAATNAAHVGAVILLGNRDTGTLTLTPSGGTTFTSVIENAGTTSRTIASGGTAMAVHVGSDEWMLVGDIG